MLSYQQFNQIAKGITYNDIIKTAKERLMKGESSTSDYRETHTVGHIIRKSSIDLRQNNNSFYDSNNDLYKIKYTNKNNNRKKHAKNRKFAVYIGNVKIFSINHLSKYKSVRAMTNIARFMFKRNIFDDLYKIKKDDVNDEV